MVSTFYALDGTQGVDLDNVTTGTTVDGAGALFELGTICTGNDGTKWVYAQAGAAIAQYDTVAISEAFQAVLVTKALADAGHQIAFAQVAFADNDLGWFALAGTGSNFKVNVLASCAADVGLYTSGTAGTLDDTAASQTAITGVVITTANSSGGEGAHPAIARGVNVQATP